MCRGVFLWTSEYWREFVRTVLTHTLNAGHHTTHRLRLEQDSHAEALRNHTHRGTRWGPFTGEWHVHIRMIPTHSLLLSISWASVWEREAGAETARHTCYAVAEFFAPPFFGPQGKANVNHSREVRSSTSRPPPSSQPFSWVSFTAMLLPIYHSLMFHKWGFSLLLTFSRCPSFARSPSCVSSLRVLQLLTSEYWIPQISTCVSLCLRPSADRWKRKVKSIWIGCAPPRTHPPFFHPLLASSPCFPLQLSLSFSLLAFLSLSLIFSLLTLSLPVPLLGCRMEHSNLCDM